MSKRLLNSCAQRSTGFTLLELLIALFIFTFIAIIVVSAMHTVFTAQSATEKSASRTAELQIALTIMSRDFEQVVDRPITVASGAREGSFIGGNDNATFTHAGLANPMGQLLRSTLQRTRYRLEENKLIRESWQQLDQSQKSLPDPRQLITGVSSLRFQYLDQKGVFHDRWPPPDQTDDGTQPRAVRVTLILNDLGKIMQLYILPGQKNAKPNATN